MRSKIAVEVEIIDATIAELNRCGWCQLELVSPDGKICLAEALARGAAAVGASRYRPSFEAATALWDRVRRTAGRFDGGHILYPHIADWNDRILRTKDDVIGMLKKVSGLYSDQP